ncbi:hypothetical protein [Leptolyngbya sp. Cla-17]|uniref:VOC family protein n=1 Tax=Leptolyngbya sp. Cla-17 TaxID=2803751 RepID=UPI0039F4677A
MSNINVNSQNMKLEVLVLPVSDVDRSKGFYETLGWRLDADFVTSKDFRVVQLTPPSQSARLSSATELRQPCRDQCRVYTSSFMTLRQPAPHL